MSRFVYFALLLAFQPVFCADSRKVVSPDGSGDFTTVQAALDSVPENNAGTFAIFIKAGRYREKIETRRNFVHLIGEGPERTILTFDDYARKLRADGKEMGTSATPSVTIRGSDFVAENIAFENSAGPGKTVGQAVALAVESDRAIFRNCGFSGNQDTLLANSGRQFYDRCVIRGDCDFIFGNATAVFQDCELQCIGHGYVTAQSRTNSNQTSGYVFVRCNIHGEAAAGTVYLGRPWRDYARVVYVDCTLGEQIHPAGWHNWNKPEREKTAFFAEYHNMGPGAKSDDRVKWSHQLTEDEAAAFAPDVFLKGGDNWQAWKTSAAEKSK